VKMIALVTQHYTWPTYIQVPLTCYTSLYNLWRCLLYQHFSWSSND